MPIFHAFVCSLQGTVIVNMVNRLITKIFFEWESHGKKGKRGRRPNGGFRPQMGTMLQPTAPGGNGSLVHLFMCTCKSLHFIFELGVHPRSQGEQHRRSYLDVIWRVLALGSAGKIKLRNFKTFCHSRNKSFNLIVVHLLQTFY